MARALAGSGRLLVAATLSARLADEWFSFLPFGALDDLAALPGLDLASVGLLLALITVGGLAGGVLTIASDHVSRRLVASVGAIGYGLSLLGFALPVPFWALAVSALLLGASSDAMVSGCEVALVDLAGDRLPRYLAGQNLLAWVGDLIGPVVLAVAVGVGIGWQWAFAGSAAVAVAYGLLLAVLPLPAPTEPEDVAGAARGVLLLLREPAVWALALGELCLSVLDEPFVGFAIALWRSDGAPEAAAVLVGAGWVLGGLPATALLARLHRHGPVPLVLPGLAVAVSTVAVVVVPWWLATAAAIVGGAGTAVLWTGLQDRTLRLVPGRSGTAAAVVGYLALPAAAFPFLAGLVADRVGLQAALALYGAVGVLTAVVAVLVARITAGRGR